LTRRPRSHILIAALCFLQSAMVRQPVAPSSDRSRPVKLARQVQLLLAAHGGFHYARR